MVKFLYEENTLERKKTEDLTDIFLSLHVRMNPAEDLT